MNGVSESPTASHPVVVPAMVGIGMLFGVIGVGAVVALLLDGGLRLLARYARLNYRLLKSDDLDEA